MGHNKPMLTQAKIVSACGVIHNFICTFDPDDMSEPVEPQDEATPPALCIGELGAGSIGHPEIVIGTGTGKPAGFTWV